MAVRIFVTLFMAAIVIGKSHDCSDIEPIDGERSGVTVSVKGDELRWSHQAFTHHHDVSRTNSAEPSPPVQVSTHFFITVSTIVVGRIEAADAG